MTNTISMCCESQTLATGKKKRLGGGKKKKKKREDNFLGQRKERKETNFPFRALCEAAECQRQVSPDWHKKSQMKFGAV